MRVSHEKTSWGETLREPCLLPELCGAASGVTPASGAIAADTGSRIGIEGARATTQATK